MTPLAIKLEPLVSLTTGALVGVEALMQTVDLSRIRRDPMLAGDVLTAAAAATLCPTIWVNVEPHHVDHRPLQTRLHHLAHFFGLNVVIEITERGPLPAADTIAALHDLGFRVALDDVPHAQIADAVALGADIIKIDYPASSVELSAISNTVTAAGHRLVVEGLETGEQHSAACASGAHIGQGWLYHKAESVA